VPAKYRFLATSSHHDLLCNLRRKLLLVAATAAFLSSAIASAQTKPAPSASANSSVVERGKYIVESVAVCGQCHTPRDSEGNLDLGRRLQGGPVPWQPSSPDSNWPQTVPRIGGTPPAPDADMIKLLTTGIWTSGNRLRAPMPQFRMERSDAEAVVAYLKSVTPKR
jgi:mono/diheme cytochrome c family protein